MKGHQLFEISAQSGNFLNEPRTTVILPGRLTVVYIYRRNESQTTIFIMPRKGSFPGKRVFFGACILEKTGLGKLLGQVS